MSITKALISFIESQPDCVKFTNTIFVGKHVMEDCFKLISILGQYKTNLTLTSALILLNGIGKQLCIVYKGCLFPSLRCLTMIQYLISIMTHTFLSSEIIYKRLPMHRFIEKDLCLNAQTIAYTPIELQIYYMTAATWQFAQMQGYKWFGSNVQWTERGLISFLDIQLFIKDIHVGNKSKENIATEISILCKQLDEKKCRSSHLAILHMNTVTTIMYDLRIKNENNNTLIDLLRLRYQKQAHDLCIVRGQDPYDHNTVSLPLSFNLLEGYNFEKIVNLIVVLQNVKVIQLDPTSTHNKLKGHYDVLTLLNETDLKFFNVSTEAIHQYLIDNRDEPIVLTFQIDY